MSRIGKQPILIPTGVEVKINDQMVIIKGPKGSLFFDIPLGILVKVEKDQVFVYSPLLLRNNGSVEKNFFNGSLLDSNQNFKTIKKNQPLGTRSHQMPEDKKDSYSQRRVKKSKALWGLTRAIIANHIRGVSGGYQKELEIRGVGYKGVVENKKLILSVGFSHVVEIDIPPEIDCSVQKKIITVLGIDKQKVGQFAARIREIRKPEPYKGKGIRYLDEKVRHKVGKKAVSSK